MKGMSNEIEKVDFYENEVKKLEELIKWATLIQGSKLTPLKEPSDIALAIIYGQELGISRTLALQNIVPINGKAGISVKLKALLLGKAGVVTEILEDFIPLYIYRDPITSGNPIYKEEIVRTNPDSFQVISSSTKKEEFIPGKIQVMKSLVPSDYRTTLKMIRKVGNETRTATRSRNFSDYASLHKKDNWINYPKDMLFARVFSIVGDLIGADILGGAYIPDELEGQDNIIKADVIDPKEDLKTFDSAINVDKIDEAKIVSEEDPQINK